MGAYVEFESLMALQFKASGFTLRHSQPVHSLLFGRRASHVRGRGLDFEELRGYVAGDDVRSIDWKVTARAQKPYVRVYSEERDRPTMLVVDQRINMFFGSRVSMKSVTAAEVTALAAWRSLHQGDRVGAFLFNDNSVEQIVAKRSRLTVTRILKRISHFNKMLHADMPVHPNPTQLNDVLESVARVCHHDALILIASDFDGADVRTRDLLLHLSRANDVACCLIYDPLAIHLPAADQLVVSNGELQVELQLGQEKVRKNILDASDRRVRPILAWQHELGIPVLPLSNADDIATQIRHLLGHVAMRRRQL
ncbi:DUF58 domain-containing protein [Terracidiphilus gabretensis]|uniref:DUF58 domain-containing protein n=1 Tax=Terracidiphilus gabretensis TaxID=1577687 RepID=UPI00071BA263|nr:DUF58 domain-containing protein [Terracidiphilus gabretensis]